MALIDILMNIKEVIIEFQIAGYVSIYFTIVGSTEYSNDLWNLIHIPFPLMLNVSFLTYFMRSNYTN